MTIAASALAENAAFGHRSSWVANLRPPEHDFDTLDTGCGVCRVACGIRRAFRAVSDRGCRHVSLCLSTRLRTGRPLAGCSAMPVLQFIQCNRRPQRRCDRSGDRAALFDTRTGRRAMRPMRLRISRVDRDRPFLSAIGAQSPAIVRVKMPLSLHVAPPVMERLVRSVLGRCTRHLEPLRAMKTIPARHPSMVATRLTRGIWERNAQDAPSERRSARKDRTCPPLVFES